MKDNGNKIKWMVMEHIFGLMDKSNFQYLKLISINYIYFKI